MVTTDYERHETWLKKEIDQLNAELGLPLMNDLSDDRGRGITFGYIGNGTLTSKGWDLSNVLWMVFLPHPGRVGTSDDQVAQWRTGSVEGIAGARRALHSFAKGAKFARGTL